jgi:hypothetical protein
MSRKSNRNSKRFMENADTLVDGIVKSNPELKKGVIEKVLKEILEKMKG